MHRFQIRFVNGLWVAFDSETCKHVDKFRTYKDAVLKFKTLGYLPATAKETI